MKTEIPAKTARKNIQMFKSNQFRDCVKMYNQKQTAGKGAHGIYVRREKLGPDLINQRIKKVRKYM